MRSTVCLSCVVLAFLFNVVPSAAATLKMPEAPALEVDGPPARPIAVILRVPDELGSMVHVVKTSPFDKIKYPVGEYTVALLERNLPRAFDTVTVVRDSARGDGASTTIDVTVESFDAVIPNPAYKPYTADVVYRVVVRDAAGEPVFTQAATGSAQTSKGMMSGFSAKGIAAEAAARAMNDAVTKLVSGLLEAEELAVLAPAAPAAPAPAARDDGAS